MQNPHCLLCLVCISLITSRVWWPCPPGRCCSPPPPPWSPSSAWSRQTERALSLGSRRSGWGTLQSIIPHSTTFFLFLHILAHFPTLINILLTFQGDHVTFSEKRVRPTEFCGGSQRTTCCHLIKLSLSVLIERKEDLKDVSFFNWGAVANEILHTRDAAHQLPVRTWLFFLYFSG